MTGAQLYGEQPRHLWGHCGRQAPGGPYCGAPAIMHLLYTLPGTDDTTAAYSCADHLTEARAAGAIDEHEPEGDCITPGAIWYFSRGGRPSWCGAPEEQTWEAAMAEVLDLVATP